MESIHGSIIGLGNSLDKFLGTTFEVLLRWYLLGYLSTWTLASITSISKFFE